MSSNKIILLCDTRDFHSMDWFKIVDSITLNDSIYVASDFYPEGDNSNIDDFNLVNESKLFKLFNITKFLIRDKSLFSDFWRNVLKLLVTPIQVYKLRKLDKKYPDSIFHAHSMYYIFLSWLSKVKYIATPMGSDVLVRPEESFIYKYLTIKSLKAAYIITVDSINLKSKIFQLTNRSSEIIQNGIDTSEILNFAKQGITKQGIVSIRGMYANYQIENIIISRDLIHPKPQIKFVYPFFEVNYLNRVLLLSDSSDLDIGRLNKADLYQLLSNTLLVVSIPISDSSPRSVYEAIFCGCCVAVTWSPWVSSLPECMSNRVIIDDIQNPNWLKEAIGKANIISSVNFVPSKEAIQTFDQYQSMKIVCENIYKVKTL
jgi:hypothetical protein